jgi:hypothetical protein
MMLSTTAFSPTPNATIATNPMATIAPATIHSGTDRSPSLFVRE